MPAKRSAGSLRIGPRPLGGLQSAVMDLLWEADGRWLTPADVRTRLGVTRAYTTVMTVLSRLARQGLVEQRTDGKAYLYRAASSRADFGSVRLQALLDEADDAASALARFVRDLDASQRSSLQLGIETRLDSDGA